jgi:hypothetical protein
MTLLPYTLAHCEKLRRYRKLATSSLRSTPIAAVQPPYCTQCRTLRSTDQRGGFGTAFLPKIQ